MTALTPEAWAAPWLSNAAPAMLDLWRAENAWSERMGWFAPALGTPIQGAPRPVEPADPRQSRRVPA
jgi:hypothetical protein